MNNLKLDIEAIIKAYNNGESMSSISKKFNTHAMTVSRLLEKNGVKLRHDTISKGTYLVKDGEKLIEWAKAQGRLVTKEELANVIGRKRLSHSYFIKYPELAQYIKPTIRNELQTYIQQLYDWLNKNDIPYKPNDKTCLNGISVHALLLDSYKDIILHVAIKPYCVSKKNYTNMIDSRLAKAKENGLHILFLEEKHFENLDSIKGLLDSLKYSKER